MKFPFSDRLPNIDDEEVKKKRKELSKMKFSSSDKFTMVWTAFLFIFLPCVGVLLLIVFLAMLMFGLL